MWQADLSSKPIVFIILGKNFYVTDFGKIAPFQGSPYYLFFVADMKKLRPCKLWKILFDGNNFFSLQSFRICHHLIVKSMHFRRGSSIQGGFNCFSGVLCIYMSNIKMSVQCSCWCVYWDNSSIGKVSKIYHLPKNIPPPFVLRFLQKVIWDFE